MTSKKKENAQVISQERIAQGIYSMWIKTEAAAEAKPGQFISMYTNDGSKLLPRPISICEIDKENVSLRVVYRVTGENTGTEEFSRLDAGDTIPVIGPLGNGFPTEKAAGKRVFLMGGGIGVPPILELAKQMECEKKQIVAGYRDAETFLREEFEQNGEVYISTEDGSVGTKGNVMDAIRENTLEADIIYACGPTPMLRALRRSSRVSRSFPLSRASDGVNIPSPSILTEYPIPIHRDSCCVRHRISPHTSPDVNELLPSICSAIICVPICPSRQRRGNSTRSPSSLGRFISCIVYFAILRPIYLVITLYFKLIFPYTLNISFLIL